MNDARNEKTKAIVFCRLHVDGGGARNGGLGEAARPFSFNGGPNFPTYTAGAWNYKKLGGALANGDLRTALKAAGR